MGRAPLPELVARAGLDGVMAGQYLIMTDPISAGPIRGRRSGAIWIPVAAASVVLAAELLHRRASRQVPRAAGGVLTVIVLGYPTPKSGRPHPVQRWRTETAVRTLVGSPGGVLVFTGGSRVGGVSEAETMAAYACGALGTSDARVQLETRARTTWENVLLTLPMVESADRIVIASDPMHAARARRYFRAQRPDMAKRLVGADDYRPGEHSVLKIGTAAYETFLAVRSMLRRPRGPT